MKRIACRILVLTVLATLGCAADEDEKQAAATQNANHFAGVLATAKWQLKSITVNGASRQPPPLGRPTLSATPTELFGGTGCNHYSTGYTADADGTIRFQGGGGVTEMACDFMKMEADYIAVLWKSNRFTLKGGVLELSDGTPKNKLVFVPYQSKSLPLRNTTWRLTNFTSSDEVTESAERPHSNDITLQLTDNQASGSGGCNTYRCGVAFQDDGRVEFQVAMSTRKSCDDAVMRDEARYLGTLPKMTRYQILENTLVLKNKDGSVGLQFEAATPNPAD